MRVGILAHSLFINKIMGKAIANYWFHILAIITVIIWGTTFVSTKVLINNGLEPTEIFIYRFLIAYICIIFISPKILWSKTAKDEILMFLAGVTGGSLYFITENTALEYTQAINVAMIIAITPLLTTLLALIFFKSERTKSPMRIVLGSIIALCGVITVITNGNSNMNFNIKGDTLTLCAAFSWAFYSLLLKILGKKYSAVFITRKVFGYGIISIALMLPFHCPDFNFSLLAKPEIAANILYLGGVASMLCFTIWSAVVKKIGTVKSTNYINLNPIATFVSAYIVLGEVISLISFIGAITIIAGVYIIEKKS